VTGGGSGARVEGTVGGEVGGTVGASGACVVGGSGARVVGGRTGPGFRSAAIDTQLLYFAHDSKMFLAASPQFVPSFAILAMLSGNSSSLPELAIVDAFPSRGKRSTYFPQIPSTSKSSVPLAAISMMLCGNSSGSMGSFSSSWSKL